MSSNRKIAMYIAAAFLFSSCAKNEIRTADIIDISSIVGREVNYSTVECVIGDVEREVTAQGSVYYPYGSRIEFNENQEGRLKSIEVYNNDYVTEGTVLAVISYDNIELSAEYEKLRLEISHDEERLFADKSQKLRDIDILEADLANITTRDPDYRNKFKIQKLKVERAECELEYFVYSAQKRIDEKKEVLQGIEDKMQGHTITAPHNGRVTDVVFVSQGDLVRPGTFLMNLYRTDIYRLRINADSANFRYNNNVLVDISGDRSYEGRIVSDPTVTEDTGILPITVSFTEAPDDFSKLSSRRFTIQGAAYSLQNVPILPYSAVKNEDSRRYVSVVENGIVKKRYIQMGLNNFEVVEIIDGVKPGDVVLR